MVMHTHKVLTNAEELQKTENSVATHADQILHVEIETETYTHRYKYRYTYSLFTLFFLHRVVIVSFIQTAQSQLQITSANLEVISIRLRAN